MSDHKALTSRQTAAVRDLYVKWELSPNPILRSAAGQLRQAAGFTLTTDELAQDGQPFVVPSRTGAWSS